ncbi:hypothetical protein Lal_00027270 [Lupinus albus]|nr:hypothetical protein Lal_00027270 [Lupinus albus]
MCLILPLINGCAYEDKFLQILGDCNLLMAIASVLDPRCKFQMINVCFPLIFKTEEVSIVNMNKVRTSLQQLYCEYSLNMEVTSSNEDINTATNPSSSQKPKLVVHSGFQHWMSMVRENEAIPPMKSELDAYLD